MAEIAVSVIAKLVESLVDPLVRQCQYLFCVGNITKTLETEKQKLASTQDRVQKLVREALKRTEKIDDAVDKWLGEVKIHIDEVQRLEQQMKESNSCFRGRCPTWRRYCLSRQMKVMIMATENLKQRSEFDPLSIPAPIPDIEYFSSGNFVYFQSTKLASDKLLEALQDNGIYMIGLYGMGGSGKTTLVKEVGKSAKKLNLFDRVIFTTVSQTLNIRKIQGEIADMLSLELREESEAGRARRLSMRLSSGERILIILDDVWDMIDLEDVGIPFEDYRGCKILLTTRRIQVCNIMKCKETVHLHLLSNEESWTLFQKHACIVDETLNSVAQEIVSECKGLPIAIQAVGASLRGKSIEEWKEAIRRLRDSKPIEVEQGTRDAFSCLQLSYDYLRSNQAKSLFLMCCMYPEDADISVEDLFRITIGLGMGEELGSLEDARNRVSVFINHLVDSCLLMRSEEKKGHLRMHDTVRDVALWISSQENRTVVNLEKDLKVAPDWSTKNCYALTSWCDQTSQFLQRLNAPKLEILMLINIGECGLSEANFRGMGALRVIQIDSNFYNPVRHLSLPPYSLNFLTNLRTLRLRRWQLGEDLSWVLGLKRLEVLDLKGSSFKDLPQGLEDLSKLKLVDLSWIKEQSFKIIERCTQLQELYASAIQLSRRTFKLGKCFSNEATFPRLKRYELYIGITEYPICHENKGSMDFYSKALSLGELKISALSPFIKHLLQQAEAVSLYRFNGGCKNIVPDIVQVEGGMNELTRLWLLSCSGFECLVDATSDHIDLLHGETLFFPKLIKLKLEYLANLKEIWRGPPLLCFFEKLQELYISNCNMLTSLFPKCVARAMLLLQKLAIEHCSELKNIIEEGGDDVHNEIISASNKEYLVFSKLKSLSISGCDELQYVFSNSCVQGLVQLEEVLIDGASLLKYAFGQHEDEHQEVVQIKLSVLKSLKLRDLKNLIGIFSENFRSSCPCLRELHWEKCPKLKTSCVNITVGSNIDMILGSKLEGLRLGNLLEMWLIWRAPSHISDLVHLRTLELSECNKLKSVFDDEGIHGRSLPMLEALIIRNCEELEEILTQDNEFHICFPKLEFFRVENCNKLKWVFSTSSITVRLPHLYGISISECAELKELFRHRGEASSSDNVNEIVLPSLARIFLTKLPSLVHICKGFRLSVLVDINIIQVENCPKFSSVTGATGSMRILITSQRAEPPANNGNQRLSNLQSMTLKELEFQKLSELICICKALTSLQNLSFQYLEYLAVERCGKVKCILSMSGWGSLPQLRWLEITECEEVEEIMEEAHQNVSNSNMHLPFQKLWQIKVKGCNKLKCLFRTATVGMLLPKLYEIEVSEATQMEELFSHRSDQATASTQEIELPNLQRLKLSKLSALTHFCKAFNLNAPQLDDERVQINECPKLDFSLQEAASTQCIDESCDGEQ